MNSLVLNSVTAIRQQVQEWRKDGLKIVLVPTMGALHAGHLSLVHQALSRADRVITSIFINPKQFGPTEDLDRYPRQSEKDIAFLNTAGCHAVYMPSAEEMYPDGFSTTVHVNTISEGLCGAVRPVFFDGVATVVTKLLIQVLPDIALFGEKDYQQLQVVKALVRDLDIPVLIEGGATVRDSDGLALSSRNAYLTAAERRIAPQLFEIMTMTASQLRDGFPVSETLIAQKSALMAEGFDEIDYFELRDAQTLTPVESGPLSERPLRLFAAVWLGKTRLIDNIAV